MIMMERRVILMGLVGLLLAASLLAFILLFKRPAPATEPGPSTSVEIMLGEPLVKPYGQVSVTVNGVEVYKDEMHTMTLYGVQWLMNVMFYWQTSGTNQYCFYSAFRMRLSYTSGGTTTTVDATIGKSWSWNSTHVWFTVTGSYAASSDWTLKWVALVWQDATNTWRTLTNDTFTDVVIPSGSDFSITLWLYWRDNNILHENFLKTLDGILIHQIPFTATVIDVGGTNRNFGYSGIGSYGSSWTGTAGTLRVTVAVGTNCSTGWWSRTTTTARLGNQVGTITPSISIGSRGVVVAATINRGDICEVALRFTARVPDYSTTYDYIVLRWASSQPLPAGTTVRIYLIPPP